MHLYMGFLRNPTAEYTTSWRPQKAKQFNDIDYMWRPALLGVVPWYLLLPCVNVTTTSLVHFLGIVTKVEMVLGSTILFST